MVVVGLLKAVEPQALEEVLALEMLQRKLKNFLSGRYLKSLLMVL